ncbi:MAG: (E)-4-hydroxy-3-methylbut-2-enyl-diphosphate synthase [Chitinophagales bacterium]|nr:(E)-4-hydroxy-3-methylbut-2-enyl-diphosphate synthase [Bacteroidota bacterium]MCB9042833.1 (E)-4-hydroxy-3-methylbut-2-enyl-diphosphate synthase [Chitinophagales bacterium]
MLEIKNPYQYCPSLIRYERFRTREVKIGDIALGGKQPIRIQSMTTTDTMNTQATADQCVRIFRAGADYVRITAPSLREAENLANIKKEIQRQGYQIPLIADIHFTPNAAELAARIVEKVRINPGNYADKKKFQFINYTDATYEEELARIRKRFVPLVRICKQEGTAMRIGTNHGSLSDRIMSRYGDSPMGMVESALEFVRICEDEGYFDLVLSMKSSNPEVMVEAYRLLVHKMMDEGMNYPLHLGVTEAGDGEDGRIKSACGIGTLLEDGLGDTVRVSLTEAPEAEVPVAIHLVERYQTRAQHQPIPFIAQIPVNPFEYKHRYTYAVENVGGEHVPVVCIDMSDAKNITPSDLQAVGYTYSEDLDKWHISDQAADFIFCAEKIPFALPGTLQVILPYAKWQQAKETAKTFPLMDKATFLENTAKSPILNFVQADTSAIDEALCNALAATPSAVLVLHTQNEHAMADLRRIFFELIAKKYDFPVIIYRNYENLPNEQMQLFSATDAGGLFIDGFGNGLWLKGKNQSAAFINSLSFGILQASRLRISKTEYISCPSCGRTLFDLEETTAMIRQRTQHLKGVKIGIMGCIVNGPGEMADADYGYVGSGVGKITLYKGKEVVKRNIDTEFAVDELIKIIQEDGRWQLE